MPQADGETNKDLLLEAFPASKAFGVICALRTADSNTVACRPRAGCSNVTPNGKFPTYSVSKIFIATLVYRLQEKGFLNLEDSASERADLPISVDIRIRDLLLNSSGLADYGTDRVYHEAVISTPEQPWSEEKFLEHVLAKGYLFSPRQGWNYSNVGFLILKRILERRSKLTFTDMITQEICLPLGLEHTGTLISLGDLHEMIPGYSRFISQDKSVLDVRGVYHPGWVSHGLVYSTVDDVNTFMQALFEGRILSSQSLTSMKSAVEVNETHPPFRRPSYASGMMCDPDFIAGPLFGHNGGGPGYRISAFSIPSRRLYATAVYNCDYESDPQDLVMSLLTLAR